MAMIPEMRSLREGQPHRHRVIEAQLAIGDRIGKYLLLDDDPNVFKVLEKMLPSLGYTCEFVLDGQSLIELYQEKLRKDVKPDLVILDLTIPGKEGGEITLRRLLEIDPEVRAVVSSGYSSDPIMSKYKEYGFVGVLAKPYTVEELSVALTSALKE